MGLKKVKQEEGESWQSTIVQFGAIHFSGAIYAAPNFPQKMGLKNGSTAHFAGKAQNAKTEQMRMNNVLNSSWKTLHCFWW